MSAGRSTILLPAVAGLLFVAIAWSALRLRTVIEQDEQLTEWEQSLTSSDAPELDDLARLDPSGLTRDQARRLEALRSTTLAAVLTRDIVIERADGLAFSSAVLALPIGLAQGKATFRFRVREGSPITGYVTAVVVDGSRIPMKDGRAATELSANEDGGVRTHHIAFETRDGLTVPAAPWGLAVVADAGPPLVTWNAGDPELQPADGELPVKPNAPIDVFIQDVARLARVEVKIDGKTHTSHTLEDGPVPRHYVIEVGELGADETRVLDLTATDTSYQTLHQQYRLARWTRPPPVVERLEVAGQDALAGGVATRDANVEVKARLERLHADTRVVLRVGAATAELRRDGSGAVRGVLTRPESPDFHREDARLIAVASDGEETIADFTLTYDARPPVITVLDAQGDPVYSPVEADEGDSFRVVVSDDGEGGPDDVEIDRITPDRRIRMKSPMRDGRRYSRDLIVADAIELEIVARDALGNTSRQPLEFVIRAHASADDGAGPGVRLMAGDIELRPDTNAVFWSEAADLSLIVEDAGGFGPEPVLLDGASMIGAPSTSEDGTRIELRVQARGDVDVTARDAAGHETRHRFPLTIVAPGGTTLRAIDGHAPPEPGLVISRLPATFRLAMSQQPPSASLEAAMIRAEHGEVAVDLQGINGEIPDRDELVDGSWDLVVRLRAVNGVHELTRANVRLTRSSPVIAVALDGRGLSDGDRVAVTALSDITIVVTSGRLTQASLDGRTLPLGTDEDGIQLTNPPQPVAGGRLLLTAAGGGATTRLELDIVGRPYRHDPAIAQSLERVERKDLAERKWETAEATLTRILAQARRDRGHYLNRRGDDLADIEALLARARAGLDGGAGPRDDPPAPRPRPANLAPAIRNELDGATLRLVEPGTTPSLAPFYVYETEVTLEMFQTFLRERRDDTDFWERVGCPRSALGERRNRMRDYLKIRRRTDRPVQQMDPIWVRGYATWAQEGFERDGTLDLPTVEQWQIAAGRGLHANAIYPTTGEFADGSDILPNNTRNGAMWMGRTPRAVASFAAGAYGLFDMAGNVVELCRDPERGDKLQLIGGSYLSRRKNDLSLDNFSGYSGARVEPNAVGFRLVFEPR